MKAILMHGKNTHPDDKWYPWFREQMELRGIEVHIPELPDSDEPKMEEWATILRNLHPDEHTVLLGHSRGGVTVLRYLETLPGGAQIKKVILLGTNSGSAKYMAMPTESNHGFYTKEGYDFEKIKSHCNDFVVFHSEDDPWVPFAHGKENAEELDAKFVVFKDKKHFGKNDGIVPHLIEEVASDA
jgi:uncharacterized protein